MAAGGAGLLVLGLVALLVMRRARRA